MYSGMCVFYYILIRTDDVPETMRAQVRSVVGKQSAIMYWCVRVRAHEA